MVAKYGMHLRLAPSTGVDGDSVELKFSPYNRVQCIKESLLKQDTIASLQGLRADDIDLVNSSGLVLSDESMLLEYGIDQSTTLTYAVHASQGLSVDPLEFGMKTIVDKALQGMQRGFSPKLEEMSTGGTYRLFGSHGEPVAVVKPADEEAYAPRNPHTYVGKSHSPGLVAGVYSTQGTAREVAAYALDGGFAGVPRTCHVHAKHHALNNLHSGLSEWKLASLQKFVPSHGHSGDFAPSFYSTSAVHRVGILDVRLVNLDRNEGNLLVVGDTPPSATSPAGLAPIDHGLCLPDMVGATIENIVWMSWPQVHEPFSADELAYIHGLDTVNDLRLLTDLGISGASARLHWASTRLLQIAAGEGLTLYDIGKVVYRMDLTEASELELIVEKATATSAHALSPLNLHAPELTLSAARSASPTPLSRMSTPSTRASSPDSIDNAELSEDPIGRRHVLGAPQPDAEWPTERTALFVEKVDAALTKLCRRQRTLA